MSDWAPGDLALCIKSGRGDNTTRAGRIYTVQRVWWQPAARDIALDFVGIENGANWAATVDFWGHNPDRFRKITPGTEIEGFEEARRVPTREPAHV
jgi:hypothetical protein